MSQWQVKALSKLTGVSVQTLHHYDHIGLLKPSLRALNGYRIYSEKDLFQLQQIIALKFFGFELSQIKTLLAGSSNALERFKVQAEGLETKAACLLEASKTLKSIVSEVKDDNTIPWETMIQLIEVYRVMQQLESSWIKEIFTTEELKQYAAFEADLKSRSTPELKAKFEKNWLALMNKVQTNLHQDPRSEFGIEVGRRLLELMNGFYGKKYAHLRTKILERGYGEGKGFVESGLTPEIFVWLEPAVDAYLRQIIFQVLDQVGKTPSSELLPLWNKVLDDIYGEDSERKSSLINLLIKSDEVSQKAKEWLQSL